MNRIFKRPVDGALYAFEKSFKVFPLKPNSKLPAFSNWQNWAETANYEKVKSFGTSNPTSNWGVYCGPSNLIVIDIDTKPDKNGLESLKALTKENKELPKETLTVRTPSGGIHYYYIGNAKTSVSAIAKGIDTRSIGGYVVAPGSRIDEKVYEIEKDVGILPDIPSWVYVSLQKEAKPVTLRDNTLIEEGDRNQTLASLAGTMRRRGMNYESIYNALLSVNHSQLDIPLQESEVEIIARSVAKYKPEQAEAASDFLVNKPVQALTANLINPLTIRKRDWIMQSRYINGFISVIVAPGGVGKSMLTMLDALAIATNKPFSGFEINHKNAAVWIYNTEDPMEEIKRRIVALASYYEIDTKTLDNIHITSGREAPLVLAKSNTEGIIINKTAMEYIIQYIRANNIKLLITDPFVRTHEVSENDNMQIDKVVWCFQRIADKAGCAVGIVHHTRKGAIEGMDSARGASSLINAARIAHTLNPMTDKEASKFGIEEEKRLWFVRMDNAKANLQPPAEKADWYEKMSVDLPNGDSVGVIGKVDLLDQRKERMAEEHESILRDISMALNDCMEVGQTTEVVEVVGSILGNPVYPHLFSQEKSVRQMIPWIIARMGKDIYHQNKRFIYCFKAKRRSKHWIKCEETEGFLL